MQQSTGMKIIGYTLAGIVALALLLTAAVGFELFGLKKEEFFRPKWQNVERKTFEQTQSYVHGKIQDLAKYYEEYNQSEPDEKQAIKSLVQINFAEFDSDHVQNDRLRSWLIEQRGF